MNIPDALGAIGRLTRTVLFLPDLDEVFPPPHRCMEYTPEYTPEYTSFEDNSFEEASSSMPERGGYLQTEQLYILWEPFANPNNLERLLSDDPQEKISVFFPIVGQQRAKRRLRRLMHGSFFKEDRQFTDNILFEGPASVGKTTIARIVAKALGIPIVELNGSQLRTIDDIIERIRQVLDSWHHSIKNDKTNVIEEGPEGAYYGLFQYPDGSFFLPPMLIFIDEAHRLSRALQETLLKATEKNDRTMVTSDGNKVDCSRVGWIFATTDRGKLLRTLDSRFTKIKLNLYTREEIAQIIQKANPTWNNKLATKVARISAKVPREALSLAQELSREYRRLKPLKKDVPYWDLVNLCIERVAEDAEIDKFGMTYQRLHILTALGQYGPMSIARLCAIAQCEEEELRAYVLAPLLASSPGEPALVMVTHRHFITPAGLQELDNRGINHLGNKAFPKNFLTHQEEEQ